jgi:hypothetical protein
LGPTELKYRILAQFPDHFYCDPDYYPVARADEFGLACQRFPELQANLEEFNTIIAHHNLVGLPNLHRRSEIAHLSRTQETGRTQFELIATGHRPSFRLPKPRATASWSAATSTARGRSPFGNAIPPSATCPICLAADTLIDTPTGPIPVQKLRAGTPVWTKDKTGVRVARPLIRISKTVVSATHQVVHLVLDDGREVWVSPGHPAAEGRTVGQLQIGDSLDGALLLSTERVPYTGHATYDLLPAGETGFYWANGTMLASSL